MSRDEKQAGTVTEAIIALVYAVLVVGCTVFFQHMVSDALDGFRDYVGDIVVGIVSFLFAMIFTGIGKGIIGFCVGKHFLDRCFVIFAIVFLLVICAILSGELMVWWLTAVCSIIGTLVSCAKLLVKRKVKTKVREVRDLEHDLRHKSIDEAKHVMKKFRGKL